MIIADPISCDSSTDRKRALVTLGQDVNLLFDVRLSDTPPNTHHVVKGFQFSWQSRQDNWRGNEVFLSVSYLFVYIDS